jgi:ribosomal-protein-serine acetyltransferase
VLPMKTSLHLTPYLQLQPAGVEFAEELFNLIDKHRNYLRKWLPFVDYTLKESDSEAFLGIVASPENEELNPVFLIRYRGELVGLVGFKDTDLDNRRTEIGYWLAEDFQHKGIMTHCVRSLVQLAFEERGLHRVQIRCAVGNHASKRIPVRLGFKKEGIERDGELLSDGTFTDIEVYSVLVF